MRNLDYITKNVLIKEYIKNKNSSTVIAKKLKCHFSTIIRKLKKFNIRIRTTSEANKNNPKLSHKNKSNGNYKDGKYCPPFCCKNCGKEISLTGFLGKGRCKKCANRLSIILRTKIRRIFKGSSHPCWKGGKPKCIDCRKRLASYNSTYCDKCKYLGKRNPNYIHGKGNDPYPLEFSSRLKLKIRKRDKFTCQKCNLTEEKYFKKYNRKLTIHHVDYDKQNCKENNLITLCCQCNNKVNFNINYWYSYFTYIIERN